VNTANAPVDAAVYASISGNAYPVLSLSKDQHERPRCIFEMGSESLNHLIFTAIMQDALDTRQVILAA
jgi:hypothetical protein